MAHFRRQVAPNTAIAVAEAAASVQAHGLSLLTDSIHNCSDELALARIYLAFHLPGYLSRHSLRLANGLNSVGLVALSGVMIWQGIGRWMHPVPVYPALPVLVGLAAAAANLGVARLLLSPARHNAAVKLAYLHNRGDVLVSLAPVAAGGLIALTGCPESDALVALVIAAWLSLATVRELRASLDDLLWPEQMTCEHLLSSE